MPRAPPPEEESEAGAFAPIARPAGEAGVNFRRTWSIVSGEFRPKNVGPKAVLRMRRPDLKAGRRETQSEPDDEDDFVSPRRGARPARLDKLTVRVAGEKKRGGGDQNQVAHQGVCADFGGAKPAKAPAHSGLRPFQRFAPTAAVRATRNASAAATAIRTVASPHQTQRHGKLKERQDDGDEAGKAGRNAELLDRPGGRLRLGVLSLPPPATANVVTRINLARTSNVTMAPPSRCFGVQACRRSLGRRRRGLRR